MKRPFAISIRLKTYGAMSLVLLILLSALYLASQTIIAKGFSNLENDEIRKNIDRSLVAFQNRLKSIDVSAHDWSDFDDSYHFMTDRNQKYIDSNLTTESITNLQLDSIVFLDSNGKLFHSKTLDRKTHCEIQLPPALQKYMNPNGPFSVSRIGGGTCGLLMLNDAPWMLAARPILTSAGSGPAHGTIIMAREFIAQDQANLSKATGLQTRAFCYNTPHLPANVEALKNTLLKQNATSILDQDRIAGYTLIRDVLGRPGLILKVIQPRSIYHQGEATTIFLIVSILLVCCVFFVVFCLILERTVLSRIGHLSQAVAGISAEGDLAAPIRITGGDEMARLGGAINRMLSRLACSVEELRCAKEEAQAATQAKSKFLASMSHELRNPLNGLLGMTDLLLRSPLGVEQRRFAQTANTAGKVLLQIINNILDFSKIEAGRLDLEIMPLSPAEIIDESMKILADGARRKGLEMIRTIEPGVPRVVRGDPVRLAQILINLINNAIKFTEKGTVTVRAQVASAGLLRFEVSDTGIGIAPDVQQSLFSPFTQADASTTRKFGGTGLGLAIAKQLTELMGGQIGLESRPGEGSTFWFTAALEDAPDDPVANTSCQTPNEESDAAPPSSQAASILLVEDNLANQEVCIGMLNFYGYHADVASNGEEALALLATAHYDLIFMDRQMPGMDGTEVARRYRELESARANGQGLKHTPIVAMTAYATHEDRQESLQAGMDDHLAKPFSMKQLQEVLARWLQNNS